MKDKLPLIIYLDDNGETKTIYSEYVIHDGVLITFLSTANKITIPLNRLIKIKEEKE